MCLQMLWGEVGRAHLPSLSYSVPAYTCSICAGLLLCDDWVCQTGNSHPPHGVLLPSPLAQILHGGQGHGLDEI